MKNIFIPPASFFIPLMIIGVGLAWACYSIVLKNLNSKDVVFSFSAMAAAFAMFYLNISLSMKDEVSNFVINTHAVLTEDLVIDVMAARGKSNYIVMEREKLSRSVVKDLSEFKAAEETGSQFDGDKFERLKSAAKFFYLNSILGSLMDDFPDWQMSEVKFKRGSSKSYNYREGGAGKNAFVSIEDMDSALGNSAKGYTLAGAVSITNGLTLPPGTVIYKEGESLVIDNPFVRLTVDVEIADNFSYAGISGGSKGSFVLDYSRVTKTLSFYPNINIRAVFKRERSGSQDQSEYIKWLERFEHSLRNSFE